MNDADSMWIVYTRLVVVFSKERRGEESKVGYCSKSEGRKEGGKIGRTGMMCMDVG